MKSKNLYTTLAFAGVLPFVACALLPLAGVTSVAPFGSLDQLANSYGLAIVCFLAGIHWATQVLREGETPFNLMVVSNVVFLATWFMFILASTRWSLATQVVALVTLLLIDRRLEKVSVITSDYLRTRTIATVVASAALLMIAFT